MTGFELGVVAAALALAALLVRFFFGPREAAGTDLRGGIQHAEIVVAGGYAPNVIRVRQGIPLRLTFVRRESGDCTSRGSCSRTSAWLRICLPAARQSSSSSPGSRAGSLSAAA
jgi:Cu+-exporting ATPase